MNFRMYTDKDMIEENMSVVKDISMEDNLRMPMYGTMTPQDIMPEYESMEMDDMDGMDTMNDMLPMDEEGNMYDMQNMMPCCMMNNMGAMPYMVELEEDEEDEKCDDDIEDIVKKIEKHHPEILTILSAYGIPFNTARKIILRIVRLTLMHK